MRRVSGRPKLRAGLAAATIGLASLLVALGVVAASPSWATDGWTRVPHDDALLGGTGHQLMQSVASTPSGFVAVGEDYSVTAAAVWFSPDGTSWTRAIHQEGIFGGSDSQYMNDVVQGPGNAVVVGSSGPSQGQDAAVWTGGGPLWKRAKHDAAVFGGSGDQMMLSVAAAGPGVVAVGADHSGGDWDAAVWTSGGGTVWTRVSHSEATFGGLYDQQMNAVAAGGPGVVAVGWDHGSTISAAAVWTSVDGATWSRVPHSEGVFGGPGSQSMHGVAAGGPALVAVGNDITSGDSDAAVWTSTDGLTWTRIPHDEAVFGGTSNQSMLDVAVGGPGLIAVGYDNDGVDRRAAVWTSPDGLTWTRVPHDEATFGGPEIETMNGIAVDGTGTAVAAGTQWAPGDYDAALWTYSAPSAPPPPPPAPSDAKPSPSSSADGTPAPTASASPGTSPGPSPEPASASASRGGATPFLIGGLAALVVASGALGWVLARRRP